MGDRIIVESVPDCIQLFDMVHDTLTKFYGNRAEAEEWRAAVDSAQRATAETQGSPSIT